MLVHAQPVPFETAHDTGIICVARAGARIDDDIHGGQIVLMLSKRLTYQPLDSIATYCIPNYTCCNREPQPWRRPGVRSNKDGEQSISKTFRVTINAIEI